MHDFKTFSPFPVLQQRLLNLRAAETSKSSTTPAEEMVETVTYEHPSRPSVLRRFSHPVRDFLAFCRKNHGIGDARLEYQCLLNRFLADGSVTKGLCLQFETHPHLALAPNWVVMDLRSIEQTAEEAGLASIDIEDDFFDAVLCTGLNRISRPASLASEIWRVLKTGGQVWTEVPINSPYLAESDKSGAEYWRMTPEGLRVVFERFDEIICSAYPPKGNALENNSFFYGLKRPTIEDEPGREHTAKISLFPI